MAVSHGGNVVGTHHGRSKVGLRAAVFAARERLIRDVVHHAGRQAVVLHQARVGQLLPRIARAATKIVTELDGVTHLMRRHVGRVLVHKLRLPRGFPVLVVGKPLHCR